jgi:hypothetical protein
LAVSAADLRPASAVTASDEKFDKRQIGAPEKGAFLMADDDRDFIERVESTTGKLDGKPSSIDQIADNFALYGLRKRAATLEDFDTELRGEIDSGSHSLRRRVQLMTLRKKMGGVHEALRKAKR